MEKQRPASPSCLTRHGGERRSDDNEKAKLWPWRLLQEDFVLEKESKSEKKDIMVVEIDGWSTVIERVFCDMQIPCEAREVPNLKTGQCRVVIGLDELSVRSRATEWDRARDRTNARIEEEKTAQEQEAKEDFERRFTAAQAQGKDEQGRWKVDGEWEISCLSWRSNGVGDRGTFKMMNAALTSDSDTSGGAFRRPPPLVSSRSLGQCDSSIRKLYTML